MLGYKETISDNEITREILENGHPVISHQMFLKAAQSRLQAAKALIQEKESTQEKNQALKELERIEGLLKDFFDDKHEANFQRVKNERIKTIKTAEIELEKLKQGKNNKDTPVNTKRAIQLKKVNAEKEYQQAFDKVYEYNMNKLMQVSVLIAHQVDPSQSAEKVLKQISQKANLIRSKQERPAQHNHYEVLDLKVQSSHIPEGELTSTQKDLYEETFHEKPPSDKIHTSASTVRNENQVGQANALCTMLKIAGKVVFKAHRHGSPSVLKIENQAEREYRTMQNVRQTLALAAKEKLEKISSEITALESKKALENYEQVKLAELKEIIAGRRALPLDVATMSLLSPVADDNPLLIKGWDDPMKQYRQVNDSRQAYWSLHGREVSLEIPGDKNRRVQLNSTFMSMGVNAARGIGTLEAQALVQRVNNRGLNHMMDNFFKSEFKGDSKFYSIYDALKNLEADNEKIKKYKDRINDVYDKKPLHQAYATLESCNALMHDTKYQLKQLREQLAAFNKALKDPEHKMMIGKDTDKKSEIKQEASKLQKQISDLKVALKTQQEDRKKAIKTIDKYEKTLDGYYRNLAIVRKKAYKKALPQLQDQLNALQDAAISDELKKDKNFQKIRLFVDALDTFYNQPQPGLKRLIQQKRLTKEKNKKEKALSKSTDNTKQEKLSEEIADIQAKIDALNKGNYRFQARFALLAQHMDAFVEWFCKSGEDRTGLLNEHIEAFCIFIEKYGYPPRWENEEDNQKFHEIMPHVHNGAPNRETNGLNDDSPGLKVTDTDFEMPSVSYYTDKKLANIASKSIKIGKNENQLLSEAKSIFTTSTTQRAQRINYFLDSYLQKYQDTNIPDTKKLSMYQELLTYLHDKDLSIKRKAEGLYEKIDVSKEPRTGITISPRLSIFANKKDESLASSEKSDKPKKGGPSKR
ncbi:MAG: hypothetical protein JSS07_01655 [Proteobacteria bacterium]|nr:hypothetical protein [Pseudomonadota bacterium]